MSGWDDGTRTGAQAHKRSRLRTVRLGAFSLRASARAVPAYSSPGDVTPVWGEGGGSEEKSEGCRRRRCAIVALGVEAGGQCATRQPSATQGRVRVAGGPCGVGRGQCETAQCNTGQNAGGCVLLINLT